MHKLLSPMVARLKRSEDGAVAMIFGICSFALFTIAGLAVDIGRTIHASHKLSGAVDAAVIAAAKAMRDAVMSDLEAKDVAAGFFNKNLEGGGASYARINSIAVQIDRRSNAVRMDVDADVPTTFAQIAGISKISTPVTATALYASKDIELGLQLDVTGSMAGRKLSELKDAVAGQGGMLDILLPSGGSTNKVRIGLAPFSAAVNAGNYALAVSDNRATNGCVYERKTLTQQASEVPANSPATRLKARSDLTGSGIADCPRYAKVQPMTSDRELLRTSINSWNATGTTAGHLGTAWAWYLISPEWASIWPVDSAPVAYDNGSTLKVAVLMTDGEYNTVGGQNSYSNITRSSQYAVDTCNAMKAKGITIYTVGFEAPPEAKETLTACASDPTKFFDANDGDALRASFRAIANEINSLRLSR